MNKDEILKKKILEALKSYDPHFDEKSLLKAIDFAKHYHGSQIRESGQPYYHHPLEVAKIIVDMKLDTASVITAILHDTIEDTDLTLKEIEEHFGSEIAKLVDGVTKLSNIKFVSENLKQAEDFRKLFLAISDDIRVLLVKIADRLHNMRTIHFVKSPAKQVRIALETMQIYAPLTERIGIQQIKIELQDLCFAVLKPEIRNSIVSKLESICSTDEHLVDNVVYELNLMLQKANIKAQVSGRRKAPYSIYMKMQHKNIGIERLSDIIAFRIIVDDLLECYQVLGLIHTSYKMVPESFQDFISTPKNNDYQSLHTVVIGPFQKRIEIQIRTKEMHEIAEFGLAAHWRYKQQFNDLTDGKQYRWIQELHGILKNSNGPEDFLQNTKLAIYYDQVFCFTPKGYLISLPKKATPIDFAYAVHSNIGHRCIGAKVNGQIVPLSYHLHNGDQVEIITSKTSTPSSEWEKWIFTGKARAEIRRFMRSKSKEQYIQLGKNLVESIVKNLDIKDATKTLKTSCKFFHKSSINDLLYSIGEGAITTDELIKTIPNAHHTEQMLQSISIEGLTDGIVLNFADCCCPIYGDKIIGIMQLGSGIIVHTSDCKKIDNTIQTDQIMDLTWGKNTITPLTAPLRVKILNQIGSLAFITTTIANEKCNIQNFEMLSHDNNAFEIIFDIEIHHAQNMDNIIKILSTNQDVIEARRFKRVIINSVE